MAKILYLAASPKAGQTEHVDRATARTLVAAGFAEFVPYRNFVEFMTETAATGSDPSNVNPSVAAGVEWSVSALIDGTPVIFRKSPSGEVTRFPDGDLAAHYGAPEPVLVKFRNLTEIKFGAEGARAQIEKAQNEQFAREQQENTARWKVFTARA